MSDSISCLVVDDEPIARSILQSYCAHLPALKIIASVGNALEAKKMLQIQPVDLIFLDINMPVLDGIGFLKTLKNPPQIILTTAYKEYALEAFDLSVCDYLLKPFSFERFMVAVDKAMDKIKSIPGSITTSTSKQEEPLFIKADGKIFKVAYNDILYAEANGNYTKIITLQHTLMPAMTFTAVEEILPSPMFIRVHRSFMINKNKITHIEGNRAFINSIEIPIGSNYKENFLRSLGFSN